MSPYIKKENREKFKKIVGEFLENAKIVGPGELNFLLTMLCQTYLANNEEKYQTYNDIIGVLECIKQEYYRKQIVPYENLKEVENGEVY